MTADRLVLRIHAVELELRAQRGERVQLLEEADGREVVVQIVPIPVWIVIALFTAAVLAVCVSWARWLPRGVPMAAAAGRARAFTP